MNCFTPATPSIRSVSSPYAGRSAWKSTSGQQRDPSATHSASRIIAGIVTSSMTLQPGAVLRHYEIRGLLGKGGMGEVWLAFDTRLKREIAIKVLPATISPNPERLRRFQQEAESVARLNHPEIVTLYSVEEEHGIHFLTMELVRGSGLDTLLTPEGLPLDDVLHIGIAVASALAAAHDKQVVHRDLKPANIIVGGRNEVKVLDFGLAKLTDAERPFEESAATAVKTPVTLEGTVMGTVAYMSPEQARGKPVDHRTDLFSMGVVLYELITGRRPFHGETSADTTSAILRETAPLVSDVKPGVPRELARIVARCLEKDPERRLGSARDLRNELQAIAEERRNGAGLAKTVVAKKARFVWTASVAIAAAIVMGLAIVRSGSKIGSPPVVPPQTARGTPASPSAADPRSIAVLPFADLSPRKDQEYFSDGISEEVLNLLARIPELRVTSRGSSFSVRTASRSTREIATTLQVAYLLDGSVRTSANRVRITARLIDASSDTEVWSQTWDRSLSDVFAIQDEIAKDVTGQLRVSLLGDAPRARKTTPAAYASYLQALKRQSKRTAADLKAAAVLLLRTVDIDPRYAPAWSALADNYLDQANVGALPPEEGRTRAREMSLRALEVDPLFAEAHARLAMITMPEDAAAAARHLERGLSVEPSNAALRTAAVALLRNLGRLGEALRVGELAVREDPLNPARMNNYALVLRDAGRLDESTAIFRRAIELAPHRGVTRGALAKVLLLKGDAHAALETAQEEPTETFRTMSFAMAQYAIGRRAESDHSLALLKAKYAKEAAFNIAEIHAFRGERDQAFEWLDHAVESDDTGLQVLATNPFLKSLRSDPRWLPLLKRCGRDPDALARIEFKMPAGR